MMKRIAGVALALMLVVPGPLSAHRLDEYLQALRVDIGPDRTLLELDLTPGANLAPDVVAALDNNHDGEIAAAEAARYVADVLQSIEVSIDGRLAALTLTRQSLPTSDELSAGVGVIRLALSIDNVQAGGAHQLVVRNGYRPDVGVYLANALQPASNAITISRQQRDPDQRVLSIDYVVARPALTRASASWTALAAALIGLSVWWRGPRQV